MPDENASPTSNRSRTASSAGDACAAARSTILSTDASVDIVPPGSFGTSGPRTSRDCCEPHCRHADNFQCAVLTKSFLAPPSALDRAEGPVVEMLDRPGD